MRDVPEQYALFINGEFVEGTGRISVINPATEAVVGEVGTASPDQILASIAAARGAFDRGSWATLKRAERVTIVTRLLDYFETNAERLRRIIVQEAGCPVGSPVMAAQLDGPLRQTRDLLAYYLTLPEIEQNPVPLMERISASGAFVESAKRYVPVGVVSAISAYNFPFFLNLWKVVPALMTGNTVVLRPSPLTPYSALIFGEAANAIGLPPGVLNVIVDAGVEGGVTLTSHPDIDMVTFTGSSLVGEKVAAQASRRGCGVVVRLRLGAHRDRAQLRDCGFHRGRKLRC
ncbi:MAG: aldehyde dehydrogenase family protein, partial [Spongiibacteraceae bacterium]